MKDCSVRITDKSSKSVLYAHHYYIIVLSRTLITFFAYFTNIAINIYNRIEVTPPSILHCGRDSYLVGIHSICGKICSDYRTMTLPF